MTREQADQIEQDHNVWVDHETDQFIVGGGRGAINGWMPVPPEWMEGYDNDMAMDTRN